MQDPVVAADGYSYERVAIQGWLAHHTSSPLTNLPLPHKQLTPNRTLLSTIKEWRVGRRRHQHHQQQQQPEVQQEQEPAGESRDSAPAARATQRRWVCVLWGGAAAVGWYALGHGAAALCTRRNRPHAAARGGAQGRGG